MKRAVVATAVLLAAVGPAQTRQQYWLDHAQSVGVLGHRDITALAVAETSLYVGAGESLFVVSLATPKSPVANLTSRLDKGARDEVTAILVDSVRRELWIALNGNTNAAACYGYDVTKRHCPRSFLDGLVQFQTELQTRAPQPSLSAFVSDGRRALVGFFKGDVYLYSAETKQYRRVYRPTNIYNWPVAAALSDESGFVATRGDGLIVVNMKTGDAARLADRPTGSIRALAVRGSELYIGARGLYRARIAELVSAGFGADRHSACHP